MAQQGDLSRGQRVVVSAVVWVIVAPLVVGLTMVSWALGLILAGAAVWTTYDYVRHGDMARHVVDDMSQEGLVGKAVEDTYFGGDPIDDR